MNRGIRRLAGSWIGRARVRRSVAIPADTGTHRALGGHGRGAGGLPLVGQLRREQLPFEARSGNLQRRVPELPEFAISGSEGVERLDLSLQRSRDVHRVLRADAVPARDAVRAQVAPSVAIGPWRCGASARRLRLKALGMISYPLIPVCALGIRERCAGPCLAYLVPERFELGKEQWCPAGAMRRPRAVRAAGTRLHHSKTATN